MSNPLKSSHVTLHVTIRVAPENIKPFLDALRPCWEGVVNEPECVFFDVFHDSANPGTFRFIECWTKDETWLREVQLKRSYYEPYVTITEQMWLAPREIQVLDRVEGWSFASEGYLAGSQKH